MNKKKRVTIQKKNNLTFNYLEKKTLHITMNKKDIKA